MGKVLGIYHEDNNPSVQLFDCLNCNDVATCQCFFLARDILSSL